MPAKDPDRISHVVHGGIACIACHRGEKRPGADDHQPCDRAECHQKEFVAAPGRVCRVCHDDVASAPLSGKTRPFPPTDPWQSEPSRFAHALHLDRGKMEGAVGFHVGCVDCHVADGRLVRPNHATCARCHAAEAGVRRAPPMYDCAGCHERATHQRTRARLIRDDLHFDHAVHVADRQNKSIACTECHAATSRSSSYADHSAPRIEACVGCHDDSDRTPLANAMRQCDSCHAGRIQRVTTLAPRSHLPATERPLDHTLAFRRDHADAAGRAAARCAACHTQMSGNARDACDECHQTMRPADHRVMFRELDHGPEAAADRARCARCHVVDFCTACHSQRPRSHGYAGTFLADHGPLARVNVRACLTCHQERYCDGCHQAPATRRR